MAGPERKVYFAQEHPPGSQAHEGVGVTIAGRPFDDLFYDFTLARSNSETGTICFAESFESLAEGLQNALWGFGAA
jgi:hypothetical protein